MYVPCSICLPLHRIVVQNCVGHNFRLIGTRYDWKQLPEVPAQDEHFASEWSCIAGEIAQQAIYAIQGGQGYHGNFVPQDQLCPAQNFSAWFLGSDAGSRIILRHVDG